MKRKEHDYLGEMEIDDELYYGIQAARGISMSSATGHSLAEDASLLIYYLALIKKSSAAANVKTGGISQEIGDAIGAVCEEIMRGEHSDQFPVDMVTGGGGISVHMNVNEVIANRANEIITGHKGFDKVHPNTHVNMGESTNDVVPAATMLSMHTLLKETASKCDGLYAAADKKAREWKDVVKLGRTCVQDALPMTFGQEMSAYAALFKRESENISGLAEKCTVLPLGGTAVGTGEGTVPGYTEELYKELTRATGCEIRQNSNLFDAFQNADLYVRISAELKILAAGISKMAKDLRLLASGPRAGIGELEIPAVLPGSSIMPGKINPILPELMIQVYFLVAGNDLAVTMASEEGELDLNVWEAVFIKCLFESCRLLIETIPLFAEKCVAGLKVNEKKCLEYAQESTALSAIVSAVFGYEQGSRIARKASGEGKTVLEAVIEEGLLDKKSAEELLDPKNMTDPQKMMDSILKIKNIK
ncbi:MAG: aspartate ammonia-lyase [Eubacteriaceae bacterium]|jgi:aspartate ammonia-lyase|nr:aspartate ammonia-lyase [Eubacteriaceae bacterium]